MRTLARSLAGAAAGIVLLSSASRAESAPLCSSDSWNVDGAPLSVTLCVPSGRTAHVTVDERFARDGASFTHAIEIDAVSGVEITRAIDTVALAGVGSPKQLRLQIAYHGGTAVVEHAMLLPGAVVLK